MHRKKCKGRITSDYLAGRGQVCARGSALILAFEGHPLQARTKKTKTAAVVFRPPAIPSEQTHGRSLPSRRPLQKSTYGAGPTNPVVTLAAQILVVDVILDLRRILTISGGLLARLRIVCKDLVPPLYSFWAFR